MLSHECSLLGVCACQTWSQYEGGLFFFYWAISKWLSSVTSQNDVGQLFSLGTWSSSLVRGLAALLSLAGCLMVYDTSVKSSAIAVAVNIHAFARKHSSCSRRWLTAFHNNNNNNKKEEEEKKCSCLFFIPYAVPYVTVLSLRPWV